MLYTDLIRRLFQVNLFGGIKLGLDNCYRLQKALNFPDRHYATVHVAGTNGKGSVVTKVAYGLQEAGFRVGLYTSPHISCFRERIRINGEMISEQDIEVILPQLFELTEKESIPATFFELTTFLALEYFARKKVDIAVLETGLGGRMDATNIVCPILSIITSISLDHTDILGSTVELIAKEKAGIIKPRVPVVIGPQVPLNVIIEISAPLNSPCIQVTQQASTFEEENKLIARTALQEIAKHWPISQEAVKKGLEGKQPCRLEILFAPSPIILDVAHNPDGLLHLFEAVKKQFGSISLRILFGLSKNKDIQSCLEIIKDYGQDFHLVEASNGRGASIETLEDELKKLNVSDQRIFTNRHIQTGLKEALQKAQKYQQILVICGSFFIMSQIRKALGLQEPRDEIDINERSGVDKRAKITLGEIMSPNLNKKEVGVLNL